MKWMPSSVGAEPKKLVILGVLVVVLGVVYWTNRGPDLPPGAAAAPQNPAGGGQAPKAAPAPQASVTPRPAPRTQRVAARGSNDDFRPSLKVPEDLDLSTVDPNLKLDQLARVRAVGDVGGKRSLFEYYTPPPPPPPKVEAIKPKEEKPPVEEAKKEAEPAKPVKPAPTPVSFKFFGYEGRPGDPMRRALFVDGEDSFVVAEGETVRNRYKVVRIGVTSVEVEDTVSKDRQTLQIVPQADP